MSSTLERLTQYDLFGYLIPGVFSLVLLSAFIDTNCISPASTGLDTATWAFIGLVTSYIAGHLMHAVGNHLFWWGEYVERSAIAAIPEGTRRQAAAQLLKYTNMQPPSNDQELLSLCRALCDQIDKDRLYNIYLARQGFYRALTLISGSFFAAVAYQFATSGQTKLWSCVLTGRNAYILLAASGITTILWTIRWVRFVRHAVRISIRTTATLKA